jgi:predicted hydrolase (HD superfamily)
MLSASSADALIEECLGKTARASHSRDVAAIMRRLAQHFAADADLWEVVGLCHDLDFFDVGEDWQRHGLITAERLKGQLPDEALSAIAAHDHRTGISADTLLADMLKVADAAAIIVERIGADTLRRLPPDLKDELRSRLGERKTLAEILEHHGARHRLAIRAVLRLALETA